jgi:hypothetical protein
MSDVNGEAAEQTYFPFGENDKPQEGQRPRSQGELDEARAEMREARRSGERLSPDEAQALREAEIMKSFVAHPGWTILIRIVNAQLEQGMRALLEPATGENATLRAEYQKGVLKGFQVFAQTPQGIIHTADGLRAAHNLT